MTSRSILWSLLWVISSLAVVAIIVAPLVYILNFEFKWFPSLLPEKERKLPKPQSKMDKWLDKLTVPLVALTWVSIVIWTMSEVDWKRLIKLYTRSPPSPRTNWGIPPTPRTTTTAFDYESTPYPNFEYANAATSATIPGARTFRI